jgi:predicted HAD superfamily Cof-like phosphohydrolase|tara:strand:- start:2439 stop:2831 length:393 start_codon:yes stop_codon:yes gene_type:complete
MSYHTNANKVQKFMKAFGQEVKENPEWPDKRTVELRLNLIWEEMSELEDACYKDEKSLIEVADALSDILYVVYGAAHAFGINIDECFNEVHQSNMSKLDKEGKPIYRKDGKVIKGPNYWPPDLKKYIKKG